MLERVRMFLLGWRRRSALLLDAAGAPVWLVRLRCPMRAGWGAVLQYLAKRIDPETE